MYYFYLPNKSIKPLITFPPSFKMTLLSLSMPSSSPSCSAGVSNVVLRVLISTNFVVDLRPKNIPEDRMQ